MCLLNCSALHIWVNSSQRFCLSKVIKFVSKFKVVLKAGNLEGSMCSTDLVVCASEEPLF